MTDQVQYYDVPLESKASSVQTFTAKKDVKIQIAKDYGIETGGIGTGVMAHHQVTAMAHSYFQNEMFYASTSRVRKL